MADVCYLLEWFATHLGRPPLWQLHGTCAPEAQASAVLAVAGPGSGQGLTAVVGRAPENAARVRLELRGREPVEITTVRPSGAALGRFYVAFAPRASYLQRMVALDGGGNQVGEAPGQGDLSRTVPGYPPTGAVEVVATVPTGAHGTVKIVAWPIRDGFCVAEETPAGSGSSSCQRSQQALAPKLTCISDSNGALRLLYGGVPRASRRVRVEGILERTIEVPARDGGAAFDRAFFATVVSNRAPRKPIVVTARDGQGRVVSETRLPYRCG